MAWEAFVDRPEGRKTAAGDPIRFVRPAARKAVKRPPRRPAKRSKLEPSEQLNAVTVFDDMANEPCPF
jgi:hypothetical protein